MLKPKFVLILVYRNLQSRKSVFGNNRTDILVKKTRKTLSKSHKKARIVLNAQRKLDKFGEYCFVKIWNFCYDSTKE